MDADLYVLAHIIFGFEDAQEESGLLVLGLM